VRAYARTHTFFALISYPSLSRYLSRIFPALFLQKAKQLILTIDLARSWYSDDDPVHGFDHVLRVYRMAERLAEMEGANLRIVRAAALLHDAQTEQTDRENHQHASAGLARKVLLAENWDEQDIAAVEHCIRSHRYRDQRESPATLEAQILFDADKLDAIGAIGVARAIAYAAMDHNPAYTPPSQNFVQSGRIEPGERHSAYHEYLFKLSKLKNRLYTRSAKAIARQRHRYLANFFDQLIAEVNGER